MFFIKNHLYSPGPSQALPKALEALSKPVFHHRSKQFQKIHKELILLLKELYQTKHNVFVSTCTGTGIMECAIANVLHSKSKVLIVSSGKFSKRWGQICQTYGLHTIFFDIPPGNDPDYTKLEEIMHSTSLDAILTTHVESSTGAVLDIQKMSQIKPKNAIFMVDAIASLGAMRCPMDAWELDVVLGSSQKALMLPPGLSFIALSERAMHNSQKSDLPKFYFDLLKAQKKQYDFFTPWTSPGNMFQALTISLKTIKKQGFSKFIEHHQILANIARTATKALGLEIFPESPANTLTVAKTPKGIPASLIVQNMWKQGIQVASGQNKLKDKVIRLGHLGYFDISDLYLMFQVLENTLIQLGLFNTPGKFQQAFSKTRENMNQLVIK